MTPKTDQEATEGGLPIRDLFAALNARLEHAEKRYHQEQEEGDAISIANTRASFLGWRDARDLVRHHLTANVPSVPPERSTPDA